ncbi:MAG: chloride channel protein [Desulfobaccales bacterium]|jgi:CIC family chloride channel protein
MKPIFRTIFSLFNKLPGRFRLLLLSALVGVVSGLGAILFDMLLKLALRYFITLPTGYVEPATGPVSAALTGASPVHAWLLLIIPCLGGLLAGLMVFFIAPEAAGDGTDAMIEAFHYRGGYTRKRVPFIKTLASAITIGSGGSAGKEGPISQIGAGFGSIMATVLKLKPRDRRILVLAGAAGGLGAIFHAPLGAALFAPEVLYREMEFESRAILPCVLASINAYCIFDLLYKPGALFFPGPVGFAFIEMPPYLLFGLVCALVGYFYIKVFYGLRDYFFRRLPLPRCIMPALGGLMLGVIICFYPQVSSTGYGWVQMAMEGKLFWKTMLILAFLKIAATSCTISSGGSGGVFGPSVFIGAMLGGAFGFLGHQLAPGWVVNPNSFVLVGIGGFFAGVAKVPLASMIMACEMSNSYSLLVPLMLVSSVSYLLLGRTSLYEKQVLAPIASPTHIAEFARDLMKGMHVYEAVNQRPATVIPEEMSYNELVEVILKSGHTCFPVVNEDGRMTGIISANDVHDKIFQETPSHLVFAKDLANPDIVPIFWHDTLEGALDKMVALQMDALPVVHEESPDIVATMISKHDILTFYHSVSEFKE